MLILSPFGWYIRTSRDVRLCGDVPIACIAYRHDGLSAMLHFRQAVGNVYIVITMHLYSA